jgi:membrane associated rhomboid family serine protease
MGKHKKRKEELRKERQKLLSSMFFPVLLLVLLWAIKFIEVQTGANFANYGISPLQADGLKGILLAPLVHGSWNHLFNNSVPILVLGTAIFYFYRAVAYKIVVLSWIISGFWVWFMARGAFHIGASGLVYAWAAFLFFSGIIRRYINLLAISLLVAFLYGSMVWGIFPIEEEISWESHLMGALAGLILAFYYKDLGPRRKLPDWMEEEDEEDEEDEDDAYWKVGE